jgi:hypothetical protein
MSRHDFLLNEPEKERFGRYVDDTQDSSLSTMILSPFWEIVANLMPKTVAPNVISLAGLFCTIQAFYLCHRYIHADPVLITVVSTVLGEFTMGEEDLFCSQIS